MRTITLKMSENEFESLFSMAEENASMIGSSDDIDNNPFSEENKKRVKTVNKMLKYNRRTERISF